MQIFIYSHEPLTSALDEVEDAFDEALQGRGEVTGIGVGQTGSNIDIEFSSEDNDVGEVLALVRRILRQFVFSNSTKIKIDGKEYSL